MKIGATLSYVGLYSSTFLICDDRTAKLIDTARKKDDTNKDMSTADNRRIIRNCAGIMDQACMDSPTTTMLFDCTEPPPITMEDYLHRFLRYADCTPDTILLGLIYLVECVVHIPRPLKFSPTSRHCILLTCLWMAVRYLEDKPPSAHQFAATGGVSVERLLELERCLLRRLDFRLYVAPDNFSNYKQSVLAWKKPGVPSHAGDHNGPNRP